MEKLVVIPTYNERENISKMISKVMSLEGGYHLLVVDDGSPDGTGAIVKERQAEFPDRLFLLERSGKLGLGTAYIEGFRWALARFCGPYYAGRSKFPGCDSRPQGFFGSLAASMRMSATGRFSDFETYVKVRGKASPEQGPKCSKAIQKVGFP